MIQLAPSTPFMIYLAITLGILFSTWVIHHIRTRKRKIIVSAQKLYICEYCQYAYLDDRIKPTTKCPQCESFNKNNTYKKVKGEG